MHISENDVEKLKQSGICYHLQMSGDRIIAKVSIAYKPILDNIVNSNRSIKCDTGSTPKMKSRLYGNTVKSYKKHR